MKEIYQQATGLMAWLDGMRDKACIVSKITFHLMVEEGGESSTDIVEALYQVREVKGKLDALVAMVEMLEDDLSEFDLDKIIMHDYFKSMGETKDKVKASKLLRKANLGFGLKESQNLFNKYLGESS